MEVSGELHAPATLLPVKEPPVTIVLGGWVGSRVGMDTVEQRRIPCPCHELNPAHPVQ
jgi:hypothetical protein